MDNTDLCKNCTYPAEMFLAGKVENEKEACWLGCSSKEAAYRMQWAYKQLFERYKKAYAEKRILEKRLISYEDDGK